MLTCRVTLSDTYIVSEPQFLHLHKEACSSPFLLIVKNIKETSLNHRHGVKLPTRSLLASRMSETRGLFAEQLMEKGESQSWEAAQAPSTGGQRGKEDIY